MEYDKKVFDFLVCHKKGYEAIAAESIGDARILALQSALTVTHLMASYHEEAVKPKPVAIDAGKVTVYARVLLPNGSCAFLPLVRYPCTIDPKGELPASFDSRKDAHNWAQFCLHEKVEFR